MFRLKEIHFDKQINDEGIYCCSACGQNLFKAKEKFDSGTGFPSFWASIENQVKSKFLNTYNKERVQLICSHCESHLGHLFTDERTPTSLRYCVLDEAISKNRV